MESVISGSFGQEVPFYHFLTVAVCLGLECEIRLHQNVGLCVHNSSKEWTLQASISSPCICRRAAKQNVSPQGMAISVAGRAQLVLENRVGWLEGLQVVGLFSLLLFLLSPFVRKGKQYGLSDFTMQAKILHLTFKKEIGFHYECTRPPQILLK